MHFGLRETKSPAMFRYTKILSGVFGTAYFAILRWRWPKGELDMGDYFHIFFPQPTSDGWLMGFYGLAIGVFVIPWFFRWLEKDKEDERFLDKLGQESLAKAKIKLFKNLSRAYHAWKLTSADYPDSLTQLIKESEFPDWVPIKKNGDLLATIIKERQGLPSDLWEFLHELFNQLDGYIRRRETSQLLSSKEMDELHEARQILSYFWDSVAVKIFRRRELRYRNVKPYIDGATLKILVYLEIENHTVIHGSSEGPKELFLLGGVYFEKRKWGFKEWFWNPCLTLTENLRT